MGGAVPDWYVELAIADALHCPPWALDDQPVAWRNWAAAKLAADAKARQVKAEREARERRR